VTYHGHQNLRDEIFRMAKMGAAITEDNIEALFDVPSG
jgi:hypothetical protein